MCDADKSANNEPYVIKLIEVIRNSMAPYTKPFTVTGRHSDAYVYILTGTCFYEFENDSFSVKAGDILYLANDSTYRMSVGGEEYSFLYCDIKFADGGKGARHSFVCTPHSTTDAENLFRRMFRIYNSVSGERFNSCMACIYEISALIADSRESGYLGSGTRKKMTEAKLFIEQGAFDPSFTVSGAAERFGMSEAYFRRLFRSAHHTSPSNYIRSVRVERAKKLLSYQFVTLTDCAAQCGFSSVQYFTRVFRETTGMTPSQFRKK